MGDDEVKGSQHPVALTKPFYLGATVVTQEQYQQVMGKNPSDFKVAQNPVVGVTWDDAVEVLQEAFGEDRHDRRVAHRGDNGNTPAGAAARANTALATTTSSWATTPGTRTTATRRRIPWPRKSPTPGASTMCMATSGNGAAIGTPILAQRRR